MKICSACANKKPKDHFIPKKGACRSCRAAAHKTWRALNRASVRTYDNARYHNSDKLKRAVSKYGLTKQQYKDMLAAQKGACKICSAAPKASRRLHIDHCHKSGKVRGLLCSNCNCMIGLAKDQPETLIAAAKYICAPQAAAFIEAAMEYRP